MPDLEPLSPPFPTPAGRPPPHPATLLKALGLSPRKAFGQNFLASNPVLQELVSRARVSPGQLILEIGPGLGALTHYLLERGAEVVALEKDRELAAFLQRRFAPPFRLTVHEADALAWDLSLLPASDGGRRVVANLPYNVAVPIIFRLLEARLGFTDLIIMVQKEVAERMLAAPGTDAYGALTVNLGLLARVEPLLEVPPEAFYPVPEVDSSVVRIVPLEAPPWDPGSEVGFDRLVKAIFSARRKTLPNALSAARFSREGIARGLTALALDPKVRGETLSLEQLCALNRVLEAPPQATAARPEGELPVKATEPVAAEPMEKTDESSKVRPHRSKGRLRRRNPLDDLEGG